MDTSRKSRGRGRSSGKDRRFNKNRDKAPNNPPVDSVLIKPLDPKDYSTFLEVKPVDVSPIPPVPVQPKIDPNSYLERTKSKQKEVVIVNSLPVPDPLAPKRILSSQEQQIVKIHRGINSSRFRTYKTHYNAWALAWHDEINAIVDLVRDEIEMTDGQVRQYVLYLYTSSIEDRRGKLLPHNITNRYITPPRLPEEVHSLDEYIIEYSRSHDFPFFETHADIKDFMGRAFYTQYLY